MDTQTQKLMFSSKSDEWETPQNFFNKLKLTDNLISVHIVSLAPRERTV